MVDAGPFQLDVARYERLQIAVTDAMEESLALAVVTYEKLPKNPAPTPGATIEGRSAVSQIIQCMVNSAADLNISAFDIIDGFAHGLAVYMAQGSREGGVAAKDLLTRQMDGYYDRLYAAFNQKAPRIDG